MLFIFSLYKHMRVVGVDRYKTLVEYKTPDGLMKGNVLF
jgi:hypothetical protein